MRAFTFLEVVIVIAIALLVGVTAVWFTTNFFFEQQTVATAQMVRSNIVRAGTYALNGRANTDWGVTVTGGNLVIFAGTTYATRNTAYDEITPLPGNVTVSGMGEVIFTKPSGTTDPRSFTVIGNNRTITFSLTREGALTES